MKYTLFLFTLLYSSFGFSNTISMGSYYLNDSDCEVKAMVCRKLIYEDGSSSNTCTFEVYKDDEFIIALGKGGEVDSVSEYSIIAKNQGFIWNGIVPSYVNDIAKFSNIESEEDPYSRADRTITKFDLSYRVGFGQEIIRCENMVLSDF